MVDLSTAMSAAQADRGKRKKDGDKRGRSGRNHGLEPFEPEKFVKKEKAESISMWLVMAMALTIALFSRFIFMPGVDPGGNTDILWLAPMAMIVVIPSLHRAILSEERNENFTKGTWFKASFLYVFAWLAFTFLLTNPPFGDIGSPEPSEGWTILVEQGDGWLLTDDDLAGKKSLVFEVEGDHLEGHAFLLFSLADNGDPNRAELTITMSDADGVVTNLSHTSEGWDEVMSGHSLAGDVDGAHDAVLVDHIEDRPVIIDLGENLSLSTYTVTIDVFEEGDPWDNTNTWSWEFTIRNPVVE